ncbi:MAG TPA: farnesyl diphosphate synthase [Vicinamibacterales bacterium]|nr:farnesyl diphosphate synthase [Vicinamibacterales bacterium]
MNEPASLHDWLDARRRDVDIALERFLPSPPACPPRLSESMRYSLFAGGKRLRPILTLAAAEAVAEGAARPQDARALALPAACALELIHTYSLVHDDLPAMDDDTLRRGRATNHVVYGQGLAILAGDGLLTEAFALLAREPAAAEGVTGEERRRRQLRTLALVSAAAGVAGMVGGQAIDLDAAGRGARLDRDALRDMHARKTGALIRAAAGAGAIMAGASTDQYAAVDRYAAELGLAFQIVDDILDVESSSQAMGKTAGKDAAAGKPTYPLLYGLEASRTLAHGCIDRALSALETARLRGQLPAIARWVVERTT